MDPEEEPIHDLIVPMYALVGFGAQTVLVLLSIEQRGGWDDTYLDESRGVDIYSLDMLNDM